MIHLQLEELALRENSLHLARKILPLLLAPKIVCHEESSVEKILAQGRNFVVLKFQCPRLHHVSPRVIEQARIGQVQHAAIRIDFQRSQLLEPIRKIQVTVGKIGEAIPPRRQPYE